MVNKKRLRCKGKFPPKRDDAPNAFNDNEMSKELLADRDPQSKHAGEPKPREPKGR